MKKDKELARVLKETHEVMQEANKETGK